MSDNLGCGKRFNRMSGKLVVVSGDCDFICGVADGWGKESLCLNCNDKMKESWK